MWHFIWLSRWIRWQEKFDSFELNISFDWLWMSYGLSGFGIFCFERSNIRIPRRSSYSRGFFLLFLSLSKTLFLSNELWNKFFDNSVETNFRKSRDTIFPIKWIKICLEIFVIDVTREQILDKIFRWFLDILKTNIINEKTSECVSYMQSKCWFFFLSINQ